MEWNKQNTKWLAIICGAVAFYCILQNLGAVAWGLLALMDVLMPLLLGGAIAFVLNVPMRAIEWHLFPQNGKANRFRRPLALLLTLVAVIAVLVLAWVVIRPGIEDALHSIVSQIPDAMERVRKWMVSLEAYLPYLTEWAEVLDADDWQGLSQKAVNLLQSWGRGLLSTGGGLIGGLVGMITTFVIGLIFSFYILLQKEKLACQGRQMVYAMVPVPVADRTLEVLRLTSRTFSSFLSGQCLEAVILGALFVATMTIFRLPYALLVGVLIALTALIPIVGAFIGCGVGTLLIAITDPWKALVFVILFLILQQIEGNLIYPHVVGSSVGLPSIWVLAAVTVGGSLLGVMGMLLFIPLCSVLYTLLRRFIKRRLKEKQIPEYKWRDSSSNDRQK